MLLTMTGAAPLVEREMYPLVFISAIGCVASLYLVVGIGDAEGTEPGREADRARESISDCEVVQVDYQDDPLLTRGEKVDRMDRAFILSLNKFDGCRLQIKQGGSGPSSATAGNAQGGGDGNATGSSEGAFSEAGPGGSIASSEISGTEVTSQVPAGTVEGSTQITDVTERAPILGNPQASYGSEKTDRVNPHGPRAGPGAARDKGTLEDIPPADNDSVLEAQIREAAMREQDPEKQARLWDEYRRYKGLPVNR